MQNMDFERGQPFVFLASLIADFTKPVFLLYFYRTCQQIGNSDTIPDLTVNLISTCAISFQLSYTDRTLKANFTKMGYW